ncbi:MAG: polysulfide reductase, partial [Thermodesulfobacteriota bacterium]
MQTLIAKGRQPVDAPFKADGKTPWTVKEKLLLGLTPQEYLAQLVRNPFNWVLAAIFAVGVPVTVSRFIF